MLLRIFFSVLLAVSPGKGIAFTSAASKPYPNQQILRRATNDAAVYDTGEVSLREMAAEMPNKPLKVLFLSSDTGGGHRASAESLAKQFQIHFPGSTYDLLDVWTLDGIRPYKTLVTSYQHLSAHPRQWRILYHLSNTRPWELAMDFHSTLTCEKKIRRRIASYNPDVIVSVHPTMNNAPLIATHKIAKATGKHIPFFTVVTDLASGHCTWFHKKVDKLYVASDRLWRMAKRRGHTPDDRLVLTGLPIRHEFDLLSQAMGGTRASPQFLPYQMKMKQNLNLNTDKPMVLLMGGGEGVGSLEDIVNELYGSFTKAGVDATICVVCGRNEKLKETLESRDWDSVQQQPKRRRRWFRRRRKQSVGADETTSSAESSPSEDGSVSVVGLGFVTNMADYMVAADVLISKAGPGTLAEAAAVGLPVMMTSFLPGQEAGNVDHVLEHGFGVYNRKPAEISEIVTGWMQDPELLKKMSAKASDAGNPHAAADIVLDIGTTAQNWLALNGPNPKSTADLQI